MGIKTVPQPPYCPDLAPCDFWLFPKLRSCRYETIEKMKEAETKVIDMLTQGLPWGPGRSCWNSTSALQPEEMTSKGTRVSCVSSSSSCRAASTDIPDPLSPLLPITHRLRQVFRVTSCVPHLVAVCKFELVVLLLHGHMWGSRGVHRLWAHPYFSSSVPRVWFV